MKRILLALGLVAGGWPALWVPHVALSGQHHAQPGQEPAPIVIPLRTSVDAWVCAEYDSGPGLTRQPNRSCQPAAVVRQWLLQNGRGPDECP